MAAASGSKSALVIDNATGADGGDLADDSGFIVSESLTPLSRFHHGGGSAD
jgi:hypothetical protein